MAESLAEAFADEVALPKSLFEPSHSLLSETSTLLNTIPDRESTADIKTSPIASSMAKETEEFAEEPTIVPNKLHQERPSIGDWMGHWWFKGKSGEQTSPEGDKDPKTGLTPNGLVGSRQPNARRRSAKSVFGTLGISVLNPSGPASSAVKTNAIVVKDAPSSTSDTISIKSGKSVYEQVGTRSGTVSMMSPPLQPSFAPSPAVPLITTVIDNIAPNTLSKSSSAIDEPQSVLVQGATLRAIANATRVMTSDSSSILTDKGKETSPVIAQLAMNLIKRARDEGITFHDRPKEKKDIKGMDYPRSPSETIERTGVVATLSSAVGPTDIAMLLNRTLSAAHVEGTRKVTKSSNLKPRAAGIMQQVALPFTSPLLGSLIGPQPKKVSTISSSGSNIVHDTTSPSRMTVPSATLSPSSAATMGRALSVPLESIIPATAQPPTHYLSRTYTPLTSKDFRFTIPLPQSASKFTIYHDDKNQRPLTDRYGFMYDVSQYDVLLLIRAKECGNTAPACLTGVKIADREEDNSWPGDDEVKNTIEIVKGSCPCDGNGNGVELDAQSLASSDNFDSANSLAGGDTTSTSIKSRSSSKSLRRSSIITSAAAIASTINVNMANSTTSVLSVNSETPRHACAKVVRRLLDELTVIHDGRQAVRRKEWDAFVRQRMKARLPSKTASSGSNVSTTGVGGAAAAILGLGTDGEQDEMSHTGGLIGFAQLGLSSNRDERREFERLVRNGTPLVYRSKVWFECSGALEMKEPGHFQDLLTQRDGPDDVLHEIEKDVGRTMPLNIFFGGDGVGVDKLRRVLTAYSRCVDINHLIQIPIEQKTQTESSRRLLSRHEPYHVNTFARSCR